MGYHASNLLDILERTMRKASPIHVPWSRAELEAAMDDEQIYALAVQAIDFPVGDTRDNLFRTMAGEVLKALLLDLAEEEQGLHVVFESGGPTDV